MAKRNLRELTAGRLDGAVFDISEFGRFEMLKDYFCKHPIYKGDNVAEEKTCYDVDLVSSLPKFPRGQRSKGTVRSKKKTIPVNGGHVGNIVKESQNQCYFDTLSNRPQNMRSKREAEPSDCEVISERSPGYVRRSTRQQRRTTDTQKRGKLDSGKFEFYLENLWTGFTQEEKNVFTFLDSLWFSMYTKGPLKEKVLNWIKKKDILSKKYVFVPIVQWGHWFLLILCNFGESPESETKSRCMLLLDSLQEANAKQLEPGIRRFVFDIFKTKERPETKSSINKIPLLLPQVPQQKNDEECGIFVLYYINLFLGSAPDNFSFSTGYPYFMKEDWFTHDEVEIFIKRLDSMNYKN